MTTEDFCISIVTDRNTVEVTKLLTSEIQRETWKLFRVEIVPNDDPAEPFNWNLLAQIKKRPVTEETIQHFFDSIKQILRKNQCEVDQDPMTGY